MLLPHLALSCVCTARPWCRARDPFSGAQKASSQTSRPAAVASVSSGEAGGGPQALCARLRGKPENERWRSTVLPGRGRPSRPRSGLTTGAESRLRCSLAQPCSVRSCSCCRGSATPFNLCGRRPNGHGETCPRKASGRSPRGHKGRGLERSPVSPQVGRSPRRAVSRGGFRKSRGA